MLSGMDICNGLNCPTSICKQLLYGKPVNYGVASIVPPLSASNLIKSLLIMKAAEPNLNVLCIHLSQ